MGRLPGTTSSMSVCCRVAFHRARGLGHGHIHRQPVSVLHQHMSHEGESGLSSRAFACQHRLRIRRGRVGVVDTPLSLKVHGGVPPTILRWVTTAILRSKALHGSPGLEQRAIHREVVVRQQPAASGLGKHLIEELWRRLHDVQVQEPLEEQIMPESLTHGGGPLAPDGVEGDRHGPPTGSRAESRGPDSRIHLVECSGQRRQRSFFQQPARDENRELRVTTETFWPEAVKGQHTTATSRSAVPWPP